MGYWNTHNRSEGPLMSPNPDLEQAVEDFIRTVTGSTLKALYELIESASVDEDEKNRLTCLLFENVGVNALAAVGALLPLHERQEFVAAVSESIKEAARRNGGSLGLAGIKELGLSDPE